VVDWGLRGVLEDRGLTRSKIAIELGQETALGIPLVDFFALREQLPEIQWLDSSRIVWGCRMIKSEWEIDCSRKACEIGGEAWQRAMQELKPGMTTREIQSRIIQYYFEGGADLASGPPTLLGATGPDGAFQKGDVLYLDGGPAYMGYQMDYTRRAVFGKPSDRQRDEHDGMWEILFKVMDRMKPGVAMNEVFEYSQSLLAKRPEWHNYSDHPAKRIGHGIGFGNEPPSINAFDKRLLQPGMILTPEPKIESPDGLVNPEEHIVMTEDGWDRLSMTPEWHLWVVE
jgi:Xaa-Pro aminopeptidase